YRHWDFRKGGSDGDNYVAFVLRPGQPVRRVELGPAPAIEQALRQWRQDIAQGQASPAATQLRRLLWDKLESHLGPACDTVYLCPDGALAALPWAALPGRGPNTVLLEDYALALVPHGQGLLEQLQSSPGKSDGVLLAVGGVSYDQTAAAAPRPKDVPSVR